MKPDTESLSDWEYYREEITGNGFDGKMTIIFYSVRQRGGGNIVRLHNEKQARLIAAAPELLAALEAAETYMVERGIETRGTVGRTQVLPAIRAAIAKAKGGAA